MTSLQLQEAFLLPNNGFSPPHWVENTTADQVSTLIDQEEADELVRISPKWDRVHDGGDAADVDVGDWVCILEGRRAGTPAEVLELSEDGLCMVRIGEDTIYSTSQDNVELLPLIRRLLTKGTAWLSPTRH